MKSGKEVVLSLLAFTLMLVAIFVAAGMENNDEPIVESEPHRAVSTPAGADIKPITTELPVTATSSLWMVGDVMLSRQVGERMAIRGADFPWKAVRDTFIGSYVLINFESCFSKNTIFNYEESFRFPVQPTVADALADNGITHVSLANNHALDCGPQDLSFTRAVFTETGIDSFGHPVELGSSSVSYLMLGKTRVALIGLHTLFAEPSTTELSETIEAAKSVSDIQMVFVHWGEEYIEEASPRQRQLANTLAALGVDIIVGHHPHVVQPVERIGDTLVLYSLGNFIFDQYFSAAVQTGLAVRFDIKPSLALTLQPVTSIGSQNQPRLTTSTSTISLLGALAKRSDPALEAEIRSGTIDLSFLATSTKSAIITQ
ncbi:CapA family protein [Patescibacteria group bacterium]|nr:CapA family protein [Patescibacteria group bacterium]